MGFITQQYLTKGNDVINTWDSSTDLIHKHVTKDSFFCICCIQNFYILHTIINFSWGAYGKTWQITTLSRSVYYQILFFLVTFNYSINYIHTLFFSLVVKLLIPSPTFLACCKFRFNFITCINVLRYFAMQ